MTKRELKEITLFLSLIATLATADGVIKARIEDKQRRADKENGSIEKSILGNTVRINYLQNRGAALSILKENPDFLKSLSVSLVATGGCNLVKMCAKEGNILDKTGLALMVAGGASNTIDRFSKGYVVDYFSIDKGKKLKNIVFNISDFEIFAGALLTCIGRFLDK